MEIYTVPQLAKILKKRQQDVYKMVYSGEIESFKTGIRGLRAMSSSYHPNNLQTSFLIH